MAKQTCAICGKELGAFSSSTTLIDSDTIGLSSELKAELSREVICMPCYDLQFKVQKSDPQAIENWQRYMNNQQRDSLRLFMSTVLDQPAAVSSLDEAQQKQEEENRARAADQERVERERLASINAIWATSGFNFEGNAITSYRGFISEETAVGMGFFKSFASSVSNLTGTESDSLRNKLRQSKQIVMQRLREDAYEAGANAIIGLDLDYTMFGDSIVGVIVSGTAVTIVPNSPVQPVA